MSGTDIKDGNAMTYMWIELIFKIENKLWVCQPVEQNTYS